MDRKNRARPLLTFLCLLATLSPAAATGTLVCEADDKSIEFSATATLGGPRRGMVVNLGGNLDVKLRNVPEDLRKLELTKDNFTQAWIEGPQLKLQLYRERTERPGAYVLLTIDTRRVEEGQYRGRYTLETDIADKDNAYGSTPRKVRGKVTCSTD